MYCFFFYYVVSYLSFISISPLLALPHSLLSVPPSHRLLCFTLSCFCCYLFIFYYAVSYLFYIRLFLPFFLCPTLASQALTLTLSYDSLFLICLSCYLLRVFYYVVCYLFYICLFLPYSLFLFRRLLFISYLCISSLLSLYPTLSSQSLTLTFSISYSLPPQASHLSSWLSQDAGRDPLGRGRRV